MIKEIENDLIKTFKNHYYDEYEYHEIVDKFYKLLNLIPEPYGHPFKISKKSILDFLYLKFLDYSKQAFYNLVLGNYEIYNASLRILIENYIVILGIKKGKSNTWKKYYLQSGASVISYFSNKKLDTFDALVESFQKVKEKENLTDIKIEEKVFNYDWLSTDDRKIKSFKDACDALDSQVYEDFKFLSNYTHSISYIYKFSKTNYSFLNSISIHLTYLSKIIDILNIEVSNEYETLLYDMWCIMGEYIEQD